MDKLVCRTCLYVGENITFFKTVDKVKDILVLFVPELKPNIYKNTVICSQCYYFLKNVENFKAKCIENQQRLLNQQLNNYENNHGYRNAIKEQEYPFTKESLIRSPSQTHMELTNQTTQEDYLPTPQIRSPLKRKSDNKILPETPKMSISMKTIQYTETKKTINSKETNYDVIEIIDSDSDSDRDTGSETLLRIVDVKTVHENEDSGREDDIFEEHDEIPVLKKELEIEENPSFFNKQNEHGYYTCKLCTKQYKTSQGLYEHTLLHHRELKFYHCDYCNFFSLWKSALARHELYFHMDKMFSPEPNPPPPPKEDEEKELLFLFCYHCKFKTKQKDELVEHLKIHFNSGNATYTCTVCRRNFYRKWLYDNHLRAHKNKETTICRVCNKGYTKQYLKEHKMTVHRIYE